jgi:hypothetical protein
MARYIYHHYPKYERFPTHVASFDEKEGRYQKILELFNKSRVNLSKVESCWKVLLTSFITPIVASGVLYGVEGALRSRGIQIDAQRIITEALVPLGLAGTISGLGGAFYYMMNDTRINGEVAEEVNNNFNTNVGGAFLYLRSTPEERYVTYQEHHS